jgi:hypothetical protein
LAAVQPVNFGEPLPAAKFANLNTAAGQPATVDLANVLGRKPIVLVYWMAANPRSEKILQETVTAVESAGGSDKVELYSVAAPPYGSTDIAPLKARTDAPAEGSRVVRRRLPPLATTQRPRGSQHRDHRPAKGSCV